MNLYIFKYNNYYNRIVKKEETINDYGYPEHVINDIRSFNPNDGVNTTVIAGIPTVSAYNGTGDYVVITDEYDNIISHWFITDIQFNTQAQWQIGLHRDLLVDFYDSIIEADTFIEKATLAYDDPLVFNEEKIIVNQIKTNETLLRDGSHTPWIVGYMAKDTPAADLKNDNIPNNDLGDIAIKSLEDETLTIDTWEFYGYQDTPFYMAPYSGQWSIGWRSPATGLSGNVTNVDIYSGEYVRSNNNIDYPLRGPLEVEPALVNAMKEYGLENLLNEALNNNYLPNIGSKSKTERFLELSNGLLVRTGDRKIYKIQIKPADRIVQSAYIPFESELFMILSNLAQEAGFTGSPDAITFRLLGYAQGYYITFEEQTDLNLKYDMSGARVVTEDAPYDIFAIPFDITTLEVEDSNSIKVVYPTQEIAMTVAASMIKTMGSSLYDIQLVPYCPVQELIRLDGNIRIQNTSKQGVPIINGATNKVVSYIFFASKSKFSFNIEMPIEIGGTSIDKKISNECEKYRLCSPNFNGYFDFSPAKNDGVQYFNIDCCYKPFTPYIHINPNFNNLYGQDFNDPRGLICGGDFSLSQVRDQWEEYQIQNKYFQEIFDRQKQNLEIQNKYQRISEGLQGLVGTVAGGATGAVIAGNPLGAAAGGLTSALGAVGDMYINEKLRTEALDYQKDMFGFQLGNIQALPDVLTKVSTFNNNNKIFPLLEYYTCTDREKDAFAKKVAYNGMTVMVIDKPSKYIGNTWTRTLSDGTILESKGYIKGQIIRIENLEDDFHLLKSISDEFYKGVYIK
ncbi:MAG: glycine zipper family protein [Firmicutes bacterium]|nr:glycine zipper family protein [Bacillota bacterium]